ncbi:MULTISPECIES: TIGR03943 family protein [unclassified Paenibacillus]|uniref:TIGR03943 family putative permease subunit n=1 Tax=unclassified Paenibacillus TaxID=185978 RepID=UPI000955CD8F|nr:MULTISPECIES: TIGR03943 family protein [unclassified Paenibacillus]ASS68565.1 TIGR03943 family protein [Paenibacillus sp. RUD330]SIR63542.1 TIGR03943 family protein [Paenibacillus sp. RU4X]SIR71851.1 TIGR03943 family protein [Paenibacillus sp. RU4T]
MRLKWDGMKADQWIKGLILLGFGAFLLRLDWTGEMLLYVSPSLRMYARLSAYGLAAGGMLQLYLCVAPGRSRHLACACGHPGPHDHSHDHSHGHAGHSHDHSHGHAGHSHAAPAGSARQAMLYGLFLLPLLLGFALPNTSLAGSLADSKGINLAHAPASGGRDVQAPGQSAAGAAGFHTDLYNKDYAKLAEWLYAKPEIAMGDTWFIESLNALNMFPDRFEGKTITMTGFVYRQEGLTDSQFIVGRMAMIHCAADMMPYGIIAVNDSASQFKDNSWVSVTGTVARTEYQGQQVIQIVVTEAKEAKPSAVPYVYPDSGFAAKL